MKVTSVMPRRPVTSRVTPEFTQTGLSRRHSRPATSGSSASRLAAAQAIGPPLVKTTRPVPSSSAVRRSADPTRAVKARERLGVLVVVARPPVQRSVAASNHSWNSALVGLRPSNGAGWRAEHRDVVELVPAGVDLRRQRDAQLAQAGLRGLAVPAHARPSRRRPARSRGRPAPCPAAATAPSRSRRARRSRRSPTTPGRGGRAAAGPRHQAPMIAGSAARGSAPPGRRRRRPRWWSARGSSGSRSAGRSPPSRNRP